MMKNYYRKSGDEVQWKKKVLEGESRSDEKQRILQRKLKIKLIIMEKNIKPCNKEINQRK